MPTTIYLPRATVAALPDLKAGALQTMAFNAPGPDRVAFAPVEQAAPVVAPAEPQLLLPEPDVTTLSDYFDAQGARHGMAYSVDALRAALATTATPAAPAPETMLNSLTKAETAQTESVAGLVGAQPGAVQVVPREWRHTLRKLAFMARTSGGTAGPDPGLMSVLEEAEALLSRPYLTPDTVPAPQPEVPAAVQQASINAAGIDASEQRVDSVSAVQPAPARLTRAQIDAIVYASREADEGPTDLCRRVERAVQPVPAGYWLAPDEPSEAMVLEGNRVTWPYPSAPIYRAMRAAHLAADGRPNFKQQR